MDSRKEISLINNSKAFKLLSNITLTWTLKQNKTKNKKKIIKLNSLKKKKKIYLYLK